MNETLFKITEGLGILCWLPNTSDGSENSVSLSGIILPRRRSYPAVLYEYYHIFTAHSGVDFNSDAEWSVGSMGIPGRRSGTSSLYT